MVVRCSRRSGICSHLCGVASRGDSNGSNRSNDLRDRFDHSDLSSRYRCQRRLTGRQTEHRELGPGCDMTEETWLASADAEPMIEIMAKRGGKQQRKLVLFAAASFAKLTRFLPHSPQLRGIVALEKMAEGTHT